VQQGGDYLKARETILVVKSDITSYPRDTIDEVCDMNSFRYKLRHKWPWDVVKFGRNTR